eukprot:TRINITY_DN16944_c0_g1_i2.p2 TRINITY_DN16944_c0_g1~~TRINITY_DN16944_c0_g1_i2.p2  ORF type:complete len:282 (+),score=23.05 TRINITY_DN16944_c0_g1_i2:616-1461(+)
MQNRRSQNMNQQINFTQHFSQRKSLSLYQRLQHSLSVYNRQWKRIRIITNLNRRNVIDFGIFKIIGNIFGENILKKTEIIPKEGDCPTCVGGFGDTLGSCAGIKNCLSTYDDRPGFFVAPWEYDCSQTQAIKNLNSVVLDFGGQILKERNNYIYATFSGFGGQTEDVEFLFPDEDNTLSVRSASRSKFLSDFGRNEQRLEDIRIRLGWEIVPVLRNRQRLLGVVESPFDTFGPEPPLGTDQIIGDKDIGSDLGSVVENLLETYVWLDMSIFKNLFCQIVFL